MRGDGKLEQKLVEAKAHHQAGRFDRAEKLYREVLSQSRNEANATHFLGLLLHQTGRSQQALPLMLRAIALSPGNAVYHANLATVYQSIGQFDHALDQARMAIGIKPDLAEAHYSAGLALRDKRQLREASEALRRAVAHRPDYFAAHNTLGLVLLNLAEYEQAAASLRSAIAQAPRQPEPHNNLGLVLLETRRIDDAMVEFEKAVQIDPTYHVAGSNRLLAMNYRADVDRRSLFAAHRDWAAQHAEQHAEPLRAFQLPHDNDRDPDRRLRIGYVSPNLHEHSVATFLEPLLTAHDHEQVEVTCYSNSLRHDAVTARLQRCAERWRSIVAVGDAAADEQIRADGIDILIDLAGHTGGNRLMLFARRPAPVLVSYLGWQNTTGMSAIDYRLTDGVVDPPGLTDGLHSEQIVRLSGPFAVYRPPDDAPQIGPLPAATNGYLTFGSFAKVEKITDAMLALWAAAMAQAKDSRLLIMAGGLRCASTARRLLDELEKHGIAEGRIEVLPGAPFEQYLTTHHRVDVILDTYPFNGHTTTCHGLWMGVPTLTLVGDRYASRMGLSVMMHAALGKFAAHSEAQWVEAARRIAGDIPALAALRRQMRDRLSSSPLMDAATLARGVEQAYRQMWRRFVQSSNVG